MHKNHDIWVFGWLMFILFALIIPVPPSASAVEECYSTTSLAGHMGPHSYVNGRPFLLRTKVEQRQS